MLDSYKEGNDNDNERRNEILGINESETTNDPECGSILKTSYEQDHAYIEEMMACRSPVPLIESEYGPEVPIFSTKFINETITLLLNNPEAGIEVFELLCRGPPDNLKMLSFQPLARNFIANMPLSINITARLFDKAPDSCCYPIDFINLGGLTRLHEFRRNKSLLRDIAIIFYNCSKFPIKFNPTFEKKVICSIGRKPEKRCSDFDMSDDEDEERSHVLPIEIYFRELTDAMLTSNNEEIVLIVLSSFDNIVDVNDTYDHLISNAIICNFERFTQEMMKKGLTILSKTLKKFKHPPEFTMIWSQVSDILRSGDLELINALCNFVSSVVTKYNFDIIANLEIFHEFVVFAAECQYNIKEPIVECLAYIINNCTTSMLETLVTEDVIGIFIDFIQDSSLDGLAEILKALARIAELTPHSEHLQQIGENIDDIEELSTNSEDREVAFEAKALFDIMMSKAN